MSDSFEFTLQNPLSKEDWDKLTDGELEKTKHIWFETPSGKKVDYIPAKVLDKIRTEIEEIEKNYGFDKATKYGNKNAEQQRLSYSTMMMYEIANIIDEIKEIIDKYKTENDHKCHSCKHYTSGQRDGSCGSYICKHYSGWESEGKNETDN